jgi:hypothetical protein
MVDNRSCKARVSRSGFDYPSSALAGTSECVPLLEFAKVTVAGGQAWRAGKRGGAAGQRPGERRSPGGDGGPSGPLGEGGTKNKLVKSYAAM